MDEFANTSSSCEQQTKKRKRKTSDDQYELYLNEMENDYVFRSGAINPTLGENYLDNKWKSLANKLNATGNGPQLPVEEWKRRFKDWKNSTRSKYRKMQISRNATGEGPPSNIKLTELEDRGLSVWGRVTDTGFEGVEEGGPPISLSGMIPVVDQVEPTDVEENVIEIQVIDENNQIGDIKNVENKKIEKKEYKNKSRRPPPSNDS